MHTVPPADPLSGNLVEGGGGGEGACIDGIHLTVFLLGSNHSARSHPQADRSHASTFSSHCHCTFCTWDHKLSRHLVSITVFCTVNFPTLRFVYSSFLILYLSKHLCIYEFTFPTLRMYIFFLFCERFCASLLLAQNACIKCQKISFLYISKFRCLSCNKKWLMTNTEPQNWEGEGPAVCQPLPWISFRYLFCSLLTVQLFSMPRRLAPANLTTRLREGYDSIDVLAVSLLCFSSWTFINSAGDPNPELFLCNGWEHYVPYRCL